jgi:alanyl-tRNA synthetase
MQQFKSKFRDINYKDTVSNIQSCLRLNDIDEIGDGSHLLYFNMIGFFSFRQWNVKQTIDFWMEFLNKIGITPDYITIHPDKPKWKEYYKEYNIEIRYDKGCIWSDGNTSDSITGYCTEFYKNGLEIGNIVNPLGTCIDVGFGLERIEMLLNNESKTKQETLKESIFKIIESGFTPTYNKQGSLLRKLLRICYMEDIKIEHQFYDDEVKRQEKIKIRWERLKDKHSNKSKEWWYSTHGIDIDTIKKY